jgi:predicted SAM-dependent methyltransferase
MPEQTQVLTFTWENKKHLTFTEGTGPNKIVICKIEENGAIAAVLPDFNSICTKYFQSVLDRVGKDMKET